MLIEESQYMPLDDVHSAAVPVEPSHLQSMPAVLTIPPFVCAHVVGGRGEQLLEDATQ